MKKHRFTWMDGLLLAVILLLIAGTCVKFLNKDISAVSQELTEFDYKVEICGVRKFTVDALQVGDSLYGAEGKGQLGVISDIEVAPAETTYADSEGKIHQTTIEGKYDIFLTITAQGISQGDIYKVGTYEIRMNKSYECFTKYVTTSGTIIGIN